MHAPAVAEPQQDDLLSLAPDDMITVFLGKEQFAPPEFKGHPQVQFINADAPGIDLGHIRNQVSPKSRMIITTEGIPQGIHTTLVAEAKSRKHPYVHRKHPNAVAAVLANYFPNPKVRVLLDDKGDPLPEKGRIKRLVEANPPASDDSVAEAGRKLFALAQRLGVRTTEGSVTQAVRIWRREQQSEGDVATHQARKAAKREVDPIENIVVELEEMELRCGAMKEYVIALVKENRELRQRHAAIEALFKPTGTTPLAAARPS